MAWKRNGDKPLSEQMITQFTDAYVRYTRPQLIMLLLHIDIKYGRSAKAIRINGSRMSPLKRMRTKATRDIENVHRKCIFGYDRRVSHMRVLLAAYRELVVD